MNKICTSIEQSKKLIELGIDINTADMCYYYDHNWSNEHIEIPKVWDDNYEQFIPESEEDDIPAWSLIALLELIPNSINFGYENDSIFVLRKIENGNYIADYYEVSFVKDNPLDATFEIVCWLKENRKI